MLAVEGEWALCVMSVNWGGMYLDLVAVGFLSALTGCEQALGNWV